MDAIPFSSESSRTDAPGSTRSPLSAWPERTLLEEAAPRWQQIRDYLPHDLSGYSALEIGCDSGFLSLELARRGATVSALDPDARFLREAQAAVSAHEMQERVTLYQGHVYDLARWDGVFDIVLFPRLFRRVRYPMLALDIVARRVKRVFLCDSVVVPGHELEFAPDDLPFDDRAALARPGWPKLAFVENAFAGESASWWVPNRAATEAMLRASGLGIAARPAEGMYLCQPRDRTATDDDLPELRSAALIGTRGLVRFGEAQESPPPEDASAAPTIEPAA